MAVRRSEEIEREKQRVRSKVRRAEGTSGSRLSEETTLTTPLLMYVIPYSTGVIYKMPAASAPSVSRDPVG